MRISFVMFHANVNYWWFQNILCPLAGRRRNLKWGGWPPPFFAAPSTLSVSGSSPNITWLHTFMLTPRICLNTKNLLTFGIRYRLTIFRQLLKTLGFNKHPLTILHLNTVDLHMHLDTPPPRMLL